MDDGDGGKKKRKRKVKDNYQLIYHVVLILCIMYYVLQSTIAI